MSGDMAMRSAATSIWFLLMYPIRYTAYTSGMIMKPKSDGSSRAAKSDGPIRANIPVVIK